MWLFCNAWKSANWRRGLFFSLERWEGCIDETWRGITILAVAQGACRSLRNHPGADSTVEGLFRCFRPVVEASAGPMDGPGF